CECGLKLSGLITHHQIVEDVDMDRLDSRGRMIVDVEARRVDALSDDQFPVLRKRTAGHQCGKASAEQHPLWVQSRHDVLLVGMKAFRGLTPRLQPSRAGFARHVWW